MSDGRVDDAHPIDTYHRKGAANYIKVAGAWEPWDGAAKNKVWDTGTLAWVAMTQPGGSSGPVLGDTLAGYVLVDYTDLSTFPAYQGYLNPDGSWYIKKIDETTPPAIVRYCKGASDYATAWAAKESQTYDYPTIFA